MAMVRLRDALVAGSRVGDAGQEGES
jgi:hypothetical protein